MASPGGQSMEIKVGLIETLHQERKQRQLRFQKAALKLVATPPEPPPEPEPAPEPIPEPAVEEEVVGKLGKPQDIIINEICSYYKIRKEDLLSRRRSGMDHAHRMMCYMFFLTTTYTNPKIAKIINRDPSSVSVSIKKAKSLPISEASYFLEGRIRKLLAIKQKRELALIQKSIPARKP